jgi:hypothetical protein
MESAECTHVERCFQRVDGVDVKVIEALHTAIHNRRLLPTTDTFRGCLSHYVCIVAERLANCREQALSLRTCQRATRRCYAAAGLVLVYAVR